MFRGGIGLIFGALALAYAHAGPALAEDAPTPAPAPEAAAASPAASGQAAPARHRLKKRRRVRASSRSRTAAAAESGLKLPGGKNLEARHQVCLAFIQRHNESCDPWQTPTCGSDIGYMRPLECIAP